MGCTPDVLLDADTTSDSQLPRLAPQTSSSLTHRLVHVAELPVINRFTAMMRSASTSSSSF